MIEPVQNPINPSAALSAAGSAEQIQEFLVTLGKETAKLPMYSNLIQ